MVYIQAESFENGDASLYGPDKFIDKDVIVVTFNYRLGLLGTSSLHSNMTSVLSLSLSFPFTLSLSQFPWLTMHSAVQSVSNTVERLRNGDVWFLKRSPSLPVSLKRARRRIIILNSKNLNFTCVSIASQSFRLPLFFFMTVINKSC